MAEEKSTLPSMMTEAIFVMSIIDAKKIGTFQWWICLMLSCM